MYSRCFFRPFLQASGRSASQFVSAWRHAKVWPIRTLKGLKGRNGALLAEQNDATNGAKGIATRNKRMLLTRGIAILRVTTGAS